MTADRGDVNSWVQTYGGAQLRTFDKTITLSVTANIPGTSGATGYTRYGSNNQRFEYVNANNNLYNNYVDGGINSGIVMNPQDVVDTLEDLVRRTVDLIEGRLSNRSFTQYYCHSSCHSSCHTSRGRR
jgi:hypothetical protein